MKINLKTKSLANAKKQLERAEYTYSRILEKAIKDRVDPDNLLSSDHFQKVISTKTGLVSEYVMDMGVWAIQEQFIKEYHYLEKLVQLLNYPSDHHSEWEGLDEEREIELLFRINSGFADGQ